MHSAREKGLSGKVIAFALRNAFAVDVSSLSQQAAMIRSTITSFNSGPNTLHFRSWVVLLLAPPHHFPLIWFQIILPRLFHMPPGPPSIVVRNATTKRTVADKQGEVDPLDAFIAGVEQTVKVCADQTVLGTAERRVRAGSVLGVG